MQQHEHQYLLTRTWAGASSPGMYTIVGNITGWAQCGAGGDISTLVNSGYKQNGRRIARPTVNEQRSGCGLYRFGLPDTRPVNTRNPNRNVITSTRIHMTQMLQDSLHLDITPLPLHHWLEQQCDPVFNP